MDAKKCDRCGRFYEKYGGDKQANAVRKINNDTAILCTCEKTYEVCPECMRDFESWLKHE